MVDFDSTIADFDSAMMEAVNDQFGTGYYPGVNTDWALEAWMSDPGHASWFWQNPYQDPEWTLAIKPLPLAADALNRLKDAGFRVDVVTSRAERHAPWIREWLFRQGVTMPVRAGRASKAWAAGETGYDYAVEDAPHHAEELANYCTVYMPDTPYNQGVVPSPVHLYPIHRVPSLWVAAERIIEHAQGKRDVVQAQPEDRDPGGHAFRQL